MSNRAFRRVPAAVAGALLAVSAPVMFYAASPAFATDSTAAEEAQSDADKYQPSWNDGLAHLGETVTVEQTGEANLPAGTTFELMFDPPLPPGATGSLDETTGTITLTAPDQLAERLSYTFSIQVNYPDGSIDRAYVPIAIDPETPEVEDADKYQPSWPLLTAHLGETVTVEPTSDLSLPAGTTFQFFIDHPLSAGGAVSIDSSTGAITFTAPETADKKFSYTFSVEVTYPDGTIDRIYVPIWIDPETPKVDDADKYDPSYADGTVSVDEATSFTPVNELPEGTTVEGLDYGGATVEIDGTTVKVTAPADAKDGDTYTIRVTVHYPDGTAEETSFTATAEVAPPKVEDADKYDPSYQAWVVHPGVPATFTQTGATNLPAGTHFEVAEGYNEPEGMKFKMEADGTLTVTAPANAKDGDKYEIPITVAYPDGSSENVKLNLTVEAPAPATDADKFAPSYKNGAVYAGAPATFDQTGAKDLPKGTKFSLSGSFEKPEGMILEMSEESGAIWITPPADAKVGDTYEIPVTITYPDGSSETTVLSLTVKADPDPAVSDADTYNPSYQGGVVHPGVPATFAQTGATNLPAGTHFEFPEGYNEPEGMKFEMEADGTLTVTAPANAKNGDTYEIPITVAYPDGSFEIVKLNLSVKADTNNPTPATDADKFAPSYKSGVVHPGIPATFNQTGASDLPAGTQFKVSNGFEMPEGMKVDMDGATGSLTITAPANAKDGDTYVIPILVGYPDGSFEVVQLSVTVRVAVPGGHLNEGDGQHGGLAVTGADALVPGAAVGAGALLAGAAALTLRRRGQEQ